MARFLVGIDLGTTNIALSFVDSREKIRSGGPRLQSFPIPQLVASGQLGELPLLPSFLYRPGPHDLPPGAAATPWNPTATDIVGSFARSHGAKVPGRQVSSAKSWLSHAGVDRTTALLPWAATPDVERLSPLEVSTQYLRHLIAAWNQKHKNDPEQELQKQDVVITVPASFDDVARNLTAEAAKLAGFESFTLLEEPQAAFYAWLGTHPPLEATVLKPGMRCLVVDVGGGTSDFSLIRAGEDGGELSFLRDAVGEHLLLGGDNMDLALAKTVEAKLPGGKLPADQFGGLIQACRAAKEVLLGDNPPETYPVTVMGRGRSVVGGTISIPITPADVRTALFDGFFPNVTPDTEPSRARSGLQEMGLPYVADPGITRHLAAFLRQHLPAGETVEAILFNGGVFQAPALRARLLEVLAQWFPAGWTPLVLTSPSLDLAVAWGAAYFAWVKASGGKRIGGGIPRSYYIGLGGENSTEPQVLCIVPRQLAEGHELQIPKPELLLAIGEPVSFPLYTSTVRGDDQPGQLIPFRPEQLLQLPPLQTILRGGKRAGTKQVPVTLATKCTEIGTLEVACVSPEGNRWRLEFNVRDVLRVAPPVSAEDGASSSIGDVWPEEKVRAGFALIESCYGPEKNPLPTDLNKQLEAALDAGRTEWPTGLCRRLWEPLEAVAERRLLTPAHLLRWYHLTGFCLRPGFGDTLDRYRVEAVWKMLSATASGAKNTPSIADSGADVWILWRRLAGGLNAAQQHNLLARLRPTLLPTKGKLYTKPSTNELAEMWRCVASLERIDAKTKQSLGEVLLRQLSKTPVPGYAFWALTRLGGRVPLYGPLNTLVHPKTIETWLSTLRQFTPNSDAEKSAWHFCLAQLARPTGTRAVDVEDEVRESVVGTLKQSGASERIQALAAEVTLAEATDQSQLFGESLPMGLRLLG
ncbi:MAG: Hsp70 family protein [Gemmataceae bacterium]